MRYDSSKIVKRIAYLNHSLESVKFDPKKPWDLYNCLDWPFGRSVPKSNRPEDGYGVVHVNGKQFRISRVVFERFHRPLKTGEIVRHRCNRPVCYHPAHLLAGTQKQNIHDAMAQWRHCHGETHGMCKLTDAEVTQVQLLLEIGMGQTEIAGLFKVSNSLIWRIQHGKLRKHVTHKQ